MLSVMIYEPIAEMRAQLLDILQQSSVSAQLLKISASTGSAEDLARYLRSESGIMLVVLGLCSAPIDNLETCFELGRRVMQQNRDNYTLFCVHNPADLGALIQNCMRPAGILLDPITPEQLSGCLKRIIDDYAALNVDAQDQGFLLLETGASSYRIPYGQILYLEALDKKLNVCTERQAITVRKSLGSLMETLPDQFIRCHRSYVVNSAHIDQVNFAEMTLTLTNGDLLPIARSCKDTLKRHVESQKEVFL